ncbi:Early nodulin-like protein 1 [Morella rubra]|uniref:Early nodulin-like protein 1 n=1 Tax=Morella rubra TaxID=262757 RepID=A0A6A1VRK1_9ROSI|nr:Early nodulin-like protein 1 [Morella rubra]
MANLRSASYHFLLALQFLVVLQTKVLCYQYKVGDLDAWGIPTSANPQVYTQWSKYHNLKIGDSLLFLYPPSQDSVIQVTEQSYNSCNLKDPILYMNNGNSLFNITTYGEFYFTSGEQGHCEKNQKLHISVLSGNGSAYSPSYGPSALPDISPSYPTVFGTIPQPPSSSTSSSSSSLGVPVFVAAVAGFAVRALVGGIM